MKDAYKTIDGNSEGEYSDRGSKFIAFASSVADVDEAEAFLQSVKKEHFKARHHCYAYRIGAGDDIFRINDDGEPSGTAGRPIYGQILSADLRDIIIVVVRYFGGKLLGASGLIQAYKSAAENAINNADIRIVHLRKLIKAKLAYAREPFFMDALSALEIDVTARNYGEKAEITFAVAQSQVELRLKEICGKILGRNLKDIEDPYTCIEDINFKVLKTQMA